MTPAFTQRILFRGVTPVPMQKVMFQIAETLDIETVFIQEQSHKLFDTVSMTEPARITLTTHEDLELAKRLWQTPATL